MLAKLFRASFLCLVGYALAMYAFWSQGVEMPEFAESYWLWGLLFLVLLLPQRWDGYDDSWMSDLGGHDACGWGDD